MKDAFVLQNINAQSAEVTALQGGFDSREVNEPAAGGVDEEDSRAGFCKGGLVDEMAGLWIEREVEADDIRLSENGVEVRILEIEKLGIERDGIAVVAEDLHPEASGQADDMEAHTSAAQDADGLAKEICAAQFLMAHAALIHRIIALTELAGEGEEEGEGMFSHGVFAIVFDVGDLDILLFAGIQIHMVETGRARSDNFEAGVGVEENAVDVILERNGQKTGGFGHAVNFFGKDQLRFGEEGREEFADFATGADDINAGFG